jgi:hypothetical protein
MTEIPNPKLVLLFFQSNRSLSRGVSTSATTDVADT